MYVSGAVCRQCMIYGTWCAWCVVVWWDACAVYDGVHVRCNGRVHVRYIMHGALWVVCGLLCGAEPSRCNVLCEVSWVCCNVRVCNMGVWCMVPY